MLASSLGPSWDHSATQVAEECWRTKTAFSVIWSWSHTSNESTSFIHIVIQQINWNLLTEMKQCRVGFLPTNTRFARFWPPKRCKPAKTWLTVLKDALTSFVHTCISVLTSKNSDLTWDQPTGLWPTIWLLYWWWWIYLYIWKTWKTKYGTVPKPLACTYRHHSKPTVTLWQVLKNAHNTNLYSVQYM